MLHKISHILQALKRMSRNQKGTSLIEFALVFPILITIILSTLELGIMLAIKVNLQSCAMAGAYYGATGAYATGSTRTASAQAAMTNGISGLLNPANVTITIQSFINFTTASLGGSGAAGSGSVGQVGKYQIQYSYSPSSPLVAGFLALQGCYPQRPIQKTQGLFHHDDV